MKKLLPNALLAAACLLSATLAPAPGRCETPEIHGADSSFRTGPIGICWGMMRGAADSNAQVIIETCFFTDEEKQTA